MSAEVGDIRVVRVHEYSVEYLNCMFHGCFVRELSVRMPKCTRARVPVCPPSWEQLLLLIS
jgi:hypothetical protein